LPELNMKYSIINYNAPGQWGAQYNLRMKSLLLILIICLYSTFINAQSKIAYEYNKFLNLKGTEYSVATVENWSKMGNVKSNLLFINTLTGESKQVDFRDGAKLRNIEQINIDSFNVNLVLVVANTVNLNKKKGIDWSDPQQIIIFSPNGDNMKQLTEDNFYVNTWSVNEYTCTLIVSGYFDTNKNQKKDKNEGSEILLFDLTTLKLR